MGKDLIEEQQKLSGGKKKGNLEKHARHIEKAGQAYRVEMSIFPN